MNKHLVKSIAVQPPTGSSGTTEAEFALVVLKKYKELGLVRGMNVLEMVAPSLIVTSDDRCDGLKLEIFVPGKSMVTLEGTGNRGENPGGQLFYLSTNDGWQYELYI